jgi:hypothetical protein
MHRIYGQNGNNRKNRLTWRFFPYTNERVCKPGSVLNDHLSNPAVADRLKPPPEDDRANHMSSHGVAPDRVYSINMSPCDE